MKLPVRLINTTNKWRLVQGHETAPMSVKENTADASREVDDGAFDASLGQNTANPPDTERRTIRISSLGMAPVDLPYVPILLNETFITALWDSGAENSVISEEVYCRYFLYRPRQKTTDRVVTAQGATCCHLGRV
ncbi:uncharacterized protein TNCV_4489741 [Trichonephila clavipes]|nr:uncharacterized protein TNCV_4489741 [Trichonephila clavipes]